MGILDDILSVIPKEEEQKSAAEPAKQTTTEPKGDKTQTDPAPTEEWFGEQFRREYMQEEKPS